MVICRRTTLKTALLQHLTAHQEINAVLGWRAIGHSSRPRLWRSQSRAGARTFLAHSSVTPAEPGRGRAEAPEGGAARRSRGAARSGRRRWERAGPAVRAAESAAGNVESGAGPCRGPSPQLRASGSARPCWAGWRRPGPAGEVRDPGHRERAGHRRPQVNEPQGRGPGRAAAAGQGQRRAPHRLPAGQRLRAAGFTGTG